MKNYNLFFGLLVLGLLISSCKKDDDTVETPTSAAITVLDEYETPVPDMTVYAIDADTWDLFNGDKNFANAEMQTDTLGIAMFDIDPLVVFLLNEEATVYFSVEYNGGDIQSTSIVFRKGSHQEATLYLY